MFLSICEAYGVVVTVCGFWLDHWLILSSLVVLGLAHVTNFVASCCAGTFTPRSHFKRGSTARQRADRQYHVSTMFEMGLG